MRFICCNITTLVLLLLCFAYQTEAWGRKDQAPKRRVLLLPPSKGTTTPTNNKTWKPHLNSLATVDPGQLLDSVADSVVHVANSTAGLVTTAANSTYLLLNQATNSRVGQTMGNYYNAVSSKVSSVHPSYYLLQAANSPFGQFILKNIPVHLRPSKQTLRHILLWTFPLWVALCSFATFPLVAGGFHGIVQWMSSGTWIRKTQEQIDLQTQVVTQVVNGPVITSISVLFATLVSLTVSNLHSRQVDIRKSFLLEVQTVRRLQQLLDSTDTIRKRSRAAQFYLQQHSENLVQESHGNLTCCCSSTSKSTDAHTFIESSLPALLAWTNRAHSKLSIKSRSGGTGRSLSQIEDMVYSLLQQRSSRWLALEAMHFPAVHYLTLSTLAFSIGIAFLVATDQAGFIFLHGLPVKILWTVLAGSFAALGVLIYDLSLPFGGAYHVPDQK